MKKQEPTNTAMAYPGGYVPMIPIGHWSGVRVTAGKHVELLPMPVMTASATSYELVMPVPGMRREDFQIDVKGNELTVYLLNQPPVRNGRPRHSELSYEVVIRTIRLPDDADSAFTIAGYSAGMLTLTVPRSAQPVTCNGMPVVVY